MGTADPRLHADGLADLVDGAGDGDHAAFEELYRRTSPRLFATCLRISTSQHEAEEALQEAYLSIWRRAGTFDRGRGTALGWLVAIARNHAIDRHRAAPAGVRGGGDAIDVEDGRPSVLEVMTDDEDERRLMACVAALEADGRRLLEAAFFGGMTYAEVARRADAPLGTVKTRIRRALSALRECLG